MFGICHLVFLFVCLSEKFLRKLWFHETCKRGYRLTGNSPPYFECGPKSSRLFASLRFFLQWAAPWTFGFRNWEKWYRATKWRKQLDDMFSYFTKSTKVTDRRMDKRSKLHARTMPCSSIYSSWACSALLTTWSCSKDPLFKWQYLFSDDCICMGDKALIVKLLRSSFTLVCE